MAETTKPCPLCGSRLPLSKYNLIVGVWDERSKLEKTLKKQLSDLQNERRQLLAQKKQDRIEMKKQLGQAVKNALEKGQAKEKARSNKLAQMIERKTKDIQSLNSKIKELQEQIKKGSSPQNEGFNFEKELIIDLRKAFPSDHFFPKGKGGDILHHIVLKNKVIATLLYECKKTGVFHNSFIHQTKKAMAQRKATYGILVTFASKNETAGFWVENNVIIVHPYGAIYVAQLLRHSLIELHSMKVGSDEIEKRAKRLFEYIKSDDFKSSVEDAIYRTRTVYDALNKEIKLHQNIWKNRWVSYNAIHENLNLLKSATSNILKGQERGEDGVKQLPPPANR